MIYMFLFGDLHLSLYVVHFCVGCLDEVWKADVLTKAKCHKVNKWWYKRPWSFVCVWEMKHDNSFFSLLALVFISGLRSIRVCETDTGLFPKGKRYVVSIFTCAIVFLEFTALDKRCSGQTCRGWRTWQTAARWLRLTPIQKSLNFSL